MKNPRIVFMGTPEFAVTSLGTLLAEGYNVVAVVTQPDRPQGRKRVLTPSPVKAFAALHSLPVLQPERIRRPEALAELAAYAPDLIITAAYGQILPKSVLDLPLLGCINVHGSLLPRLRGGAPIQYALWQGETVTGVTIMYMAEGMDTGDMLSTVEVPISDEDNAGTLFTKLADAGAELLGRTLPQLLAGKLTAEPQNDAEATYAPTIKREDERIDWTKPARTVFNQIRALSPWPVAFTLLGGEVFKVHASRLPANGSAAPEVLAAPGTVLRADAEGIEVACGTGSILLITVQPAGKKAMESAAFCRGGGIRDGMVLGE